MNPHQESLVWPEEFPPSHGWKKFFYGVPCLGPDVSFFKGLSEQQAARTESLMEAWPEGRQRQIALRLGECVSASVGWKKPYFLPTDKAVVVAYGPKFRLYEEFLWEEATREFERRIGKRLGKAFWMSVVDWLDKNETFGKLISKLAHELA